MLYIDPFSITPPTGRQICQSQKLIVWVWTSMVFGYGGQIPPKERFVHHFPPIHGRLTVNGAVRVTPGKIQKGHIPNTPWDWHTYESIHRVTFRGQSRHILYHTWSVWILNVKDCFFHVFSLIVRFRFPLLEHLKRLMVFIKSPKRGSNHRT